MDTERTDTGATSSVDGGTVAHLEAAIEVMRRIDPRLSGPMEPLGGEWEHYYADYLVIELAVVKTMRRLGEMEWRSYAANSAKWEAWATPIMWEFAKLAEGISLTLDSAEEQLAEEEANPNTDSE